MNRYPRRLIEVDLPIKRISAHARRETSVRHGHIKTLHIWWARRPLAACRAVILASLWPDPAPGPDDVPCPPAFLDAARARMTDWALKHAEKASAESFPRLKAIQDNPTMLIESPLELRNALLDFIADFADWDNSTDKDYLETSRALVQAAHEALGGAPGTRPLVVDPFAGGGSIPLEALRVGADAFASDLNPVAVLLNKVVLEYIPKYGQQLADKVRKWGKWVKQEAEKELAEFYPKDPDGSTPIAYLWARTIRCEGPGCGAEVPLIRSLWLAKKASRSVALQLVPNLGEKRVDFMVIVKQRGGWVKQDDTGAQIESPKFTGTVKSGSATCPCCGYTTKNARVRSLLAEAKGGAATATLTAVVALNPKNTGRTYRLPNQGDERAASDAARALTRVLGAKHDGLNPVPDEPVSKERPSPNARGLSAVTRMGVDQFGDLFTPRQKLALVTLNALVRRAARDLPAGEARAVRTVLALSVGKVADLANSCCRWEPVAECPRQLFARQAVPIVWDFPEGIPIGESSGSWDVMIERFCQLVTTGGNDWNQCQPQLASATQHPLPDDSASALFTDPPYYDAVPYGDLSDFFYVWLRRALYGEYPDLFSETLVGKDEEAIWNPSRIYSITGEPKDERFYELQMERALAEGRRATAPSGIGVVVFAHKSTAGWEAILSALVNSGWIATASWPVDTEMGSRVNAMGTASLASSVHLVCRPRGDPDGTVWTGAVGDWRDVLAELPLRIHDWMPRMAAEGVVGADAIFACVGPALEVFSRYSRVEKASGEAVTLKEYLEQVWAVVSTEALSMIFDDADAAGLEPDARLTAMWLWTVGSGKASGGQNREKNGEADRQNGKGDDDDDDDDDEQDGDDKKKVVVKGFALEFDAARKIAQGLGINLDRSPSIVEVKGDTARLLPVVERSPYLFGKDTAPGGASPARPRRTKQRKLFEELEAVEVAVSGAGGTAGATVRPRPGQTALDRVHQAMILFGANRGEALKQFLVDDGVGRDAKFWKLAQALSALYPATTEEKRWVDGVLSRKKGMGL
jgi:adenine-specific DNA methylase